MSLRWHSTLTVSMIVLVMVAGGCAAGGTRKVSPVGQLTSVTAPSLVIPKSFASNTAKLEFANTAVINGYYVEAKPLLEAALQSEPNAMGYAHLGTARYNLDDYGGAIEAWTKAMELNPALSAEMSNNIGNGLRDSKKLIEAEASYRNALKMEPTRWTAAVNLASMLRTSGQLTKAVAVIEQAIPANKEIQPLLELHQQYLSELKSTQ